MANSVKKNNDAARVRQALREWEASQAEASKAKVLAAAEAVVEELIARAQKGRIEYGVAVIDSGSCLGIDSKVFSSDALVSELNDRGFIVNRIPSGGLKIFI